ncbi:DUF262 domain-containing protein [Geodermatophilus sp. Leaf369]|uniref:DUF262 domain-containing protein n=1 Tax=Geodermatophilus sp. Leaf369 TaxID=1736354 RepID=UPI00190FC44E|nr:DUF262 domain-containing protein [Geodermatophilus sp. Leaf369]
MLAGIHEKRYLLPAIQREFVWGPDQIRRLMDSLMRGYPIGSFLFWEVESNTASHYAFYDFLTDYHEKSHPYATKATVPTGQSTVAILDGQQRLTALNIAVYGSHAEKKKYAWWNSSDAFPKKRLYLNLLDDADHEELSLRYDLRFLTDSEAEPKAGEPSKWFRIGDILQLENAGPALMDALTSRGLDLNSTGSYKRLYSLYDAVRVNKPINYFLEGSQDADKVLDIFVRVNSGGTTLSYSDLLLSMATNQWQHRDAREEVRALVQELNTGGSREFGFSKDVVLKTALMVAGVNLQFRVTNFTQENMKKVEDAWDLTRQSLLRAATLLSRFGFSSRSLTADSVVIPIAYFLASKGLDDSYLDSTARAQDRLALQKWVNRSVMKRGIWGSGLDTTLARIRQAIDDSAGADFPVAPIQTVMASIGKSLEFDPTEIDELLELKYGGQRTFPVLAMLYPGLDLSKIFHEDHVFPRSRFTKKRLTDAGVAPHEVPTFMDCVDRLPNLQLLQGTVNIEKQAELPAEWLVHAFASPNHVDTYVQQNDLDSLPNSIVGFMDFYEKRKSLLRQRLQQRLGVSPSSVTSSS